MLSVNDGSLKRYSTIVMVDDSYSPSPLNNEVIPKSEKYVCPLHGPNSEQKRGVKIKGKQGKVCGSLFGKSQLEEKLEKFGIHPKFRIRRWKFLKSKNEESSSNLITFSELVVIDVRVIFDIYDLIGQRISVLENELVEESEKRGLLRKEKSALKCRAKELEETAKRMLRPWKNFLPNSEDMTRALMLN